jgi:hypothetical protein
LNQAIRRLRSGDRALELAIVLESLLADGPGENTYKVGLRTALLIGGDEDTRLANRAVVGALYTLRSQLVHDGKVSDKVKVVRRGKVNTSQVVSEAVRISAQVIREVLDRGEIPDWYLLEVKSGDSA